MATTRAYSLRQMDGGDYVFARVLDDAAACVADVRLTRGAERSEIAGLRRAINAHLRNGGTLYNYQW
ncbi:MAG: hypothetical protein WC683_06840 [bacterium]